MRHVSPTLLRSDPNPGQQFEYSHDERLIRMVARTSVGPQQRIDFTYDWQGRRIGKQVWNNVPDPTTEKYIYDGWNVVAQINGANQAVKSFLWGLDLSGSMQGAGGVGGLLAVNDRTTSTVSFPCYDGNGNLVGLVNTAGTSLTAQYEYGPFGELLRATGPMAKVNPFRFSTKYQDDETDLLYYGYRYYNASTGRWLSRDPIGERGGLNLYGFVLNQPLSQSDFLGLQTAPQPPGAPEESGPCAEFEAWYQNEKKDLSWIQKLPNCPCTIRITPICTPIYGYGASVNGSDFTVSSDSDAGWRRDSDIIVYAKKIVFGSTAEFVIRSAPGVNGARQECNYDSSGKLLTHGPGAGTVDKGSGGSHGPIDVLPYKLAAECDKKKGGNSCVMKYLEVRPINNGNNCPKNP